MALINFQEQFANDVENGKKRQTIRKQRKQPFKLGETLYLYTGLRTKKVKKLMEIKCKSIEKVKIRGTGITLNSGEIIRYQYYRADLYAQDDGFKDFNEMRDWFKKTHGLPFEGILIKW